MRIARPLLLSISVLIPLLGGSPGRAAARLPEPLSGTDRAAGRHAAGLAARNPRAALRWLQGRSSVRRATVGPDGHTLDIRFGDGGRLVILPPGQGRVAAAAALRFRPNARSASDGSARALVLEPFADELGRGADAGRQEVSMLASAGFRVDVLRNGQVTVPVAERLADYSVVYMETHSGITADGDAVVATGETDTSPYAPLYGEHSLVQVFVAGDTEGALYNAFTGTFVSLHVGNFPQGSILFLNGCSILKAPALWAALRARHAASLLGWDDEANAAVTDAAAQVVLRAMASGASVRDGVAEARQAGLGTSPAQDGIAHLGYLGDGDETLAQAREGTVQAATPTPTATSTPTPTATAVPTTRTTVKKTCKRGWHMVKGKCKRKKR